MTAKSLATAACAILAAAGATVRAAETCAAIDHARQVAYFSFARLISDDVSAILKKDPNTPFSAKMEALGRTYARSASVGDMLALRKLIGIGLFTAYAGHAAPLDTTFRLVCGLARRAPQPALILDPLTCAVIAVDGARRNDRASRALAREMIDLARTRITTDPNGAAAAQKLFDDIAPTVIACSAG